VSNGELWLNIDCPIPVESEKLRRENDYIYKGEDDNLNVDLKFDLILGSYFFLREQTFDVKVKKIFFIDN
jgi:hypothetical protein